MINISIWKRLLWKEARESGLIMVIPLGMPLLANWASDYMEDFLWAISMLVVPLSITLWATMKAQQKSSKHGEWLQLPINRVNDWISSFVLPMIISGVVGAWFGYWESSSMLPAWNLSADKFILAMHGNVLLGALCMMAGFAICYMTAVAFSLPLAILMSIAWVVPTGFLANSSASPFSDTNHPFLTFLIRGIVGAVVASIFFPVLSRRKSKATVRMWAAVFILLIPFVPLVKVYNDYLANRPGRAFEISDRIGSYSPDQKLNIVTLYEPGKTAKILVLKDKAHSLSKQKSFDDDALPLIVLNDGTVYVAQQHPGDESVSIICWNTTTNQTSSVMALPAGKNALQGKYHMAHISPDGRYLTMAASSQIGDGNDFWEIDFQHKVSWIIAPDQSVPDSIIYRGDQMFISFGGKGLVVNFLDMTSRHIDLPRLPRR